MATADEILALARREIGTVEDAAGRQKYGAWYGMNGPAWCAIFTQWLFAQAHASDLIPRTAYTPTCYAWFRDHGQASDAPEPGDLVFFDWPDSVRRIQHVGIVEAVEPDSIVTIEGNTTSGTAGDQSNGGGVWRRRRARGSAIVGYGRPRYTAPQRAEPAARAETRLPPLTSPEDRPMYILCQLTPSGPTNIALLTGPMFVGLGSQGELEDAHRAIAAGAPYQWVERATWVELDKRSHALCDNPRPVYVVQPTQPAPAVFPPLPGQPKEPQPS